MQHTEHLEGTTIEGRFDGKSLRDLLRDLSQDSTTLMRQEYELFRTELHDRISHLQREVTLLGTGGLIAHVGLLALTAAIILALSLALPAWASALIVAVVYLVVGGILLAVGRQKLKEEELAPRESIHSMKQDVRTLREAFR
jgi:uncharacterized membrane protein YqjE